MREETAEQERDRLQREYEKKLRACSSIHECRVIANRLALLEFQLEQEGRNK